jgi:large repetitive protein
VTLTVLNAFGCSASHADWLKVEEDIRVYVPNAFTPGGVNARHDGLNDAFRAEFKDYSLIEEYSLQIFDRWGELIWESSDPEEFWLGNVRRDGYEGTHFVKVDVYNWRIRYTSLAVTEQPMELSGHVTIVR